MDSSSESQAQDNVEQEEDGSAENVDVVEADSTQVYQIRPKLDEKFKPLYAKEVIHNVLFDQLSAREFKEEDANKWSKEIANVIRERMKKLDFKKYKYVINVVLGPCNGSGVKSGTRCIWDVEADSYAYDSFKNDTIFCIATVYAVYHY